MTYVAVGQFASWSPRGGGAPPLRAVRAAELASALLVNLARAQRTARIYAARVVGRYRAGAADREEIAQELLLEAVRRWPLFDERRASAGTFLAVVMRRRAASLVRERRAAKRDARRCSTATGLGISDVGALGKSICSRAVASASLGLDVHCIVDALPLHLQGLCSLLTDVTLTDAARRLGIPRHRALAWLAELRHRFANAGLDGRAVP